MSLLFTIPSHIWILQIVRMSEIDQLYDVYPDVALAKIGKDDHFLVKRYKTADTLVCSFYLISSVCSYCCIQEKGSHYPQTTIVCTVFIAASVLLQEL